MKDLYILPLSIEWITNFLTKQQYDSFGILQVIFVSTDGAVELSVYSRIASVIEDPET